MFDQSMSPSNNETDWYRHDKRTHVERGGDEGESKDRSGREEKRKG